MNEMQKNNQKVKRIDDDEEKKTLLIDLFDEPKKISFSQARSNMRNCSKKLHFHVSNEETNFSREFIFVDEN